MSILCFDRIVINAYKLRYLIHPSIVTQNAILYADVYSIIRTYAGDSMRIVYVTQ